MRSCSPSRSSTSWCSRPRGVKNIAILGSTGSIGQSALSVVDAHPDRLRVAALAAGDNAEPARRAGGALPSSGRRHGTAADGADRLQRACGEHAVTIVAAAPTGWLRWQRTHRCDIVICASSGTAGLEAVLAAIDAGRPIALANKEVLVMAGGLVTEAARRRGVPILPVDSEHNAIHQCLHGRDRRRDPAADSHGVGRPVPRFHAGRARDGRRGRRRCSTRRGGWAVRSRSTRRR